MHALVKHLRGNARLDFKAQIRLLPQKSNKHVQKFNCNHKQKEDWERKQKKKIGDEIRYFKYRKMCEIRTKTEQRTEQK